MTIDNNLILTIVSVFVSVISVSSITLYRLKIIEDKQDKHNNLIERMLLAERDIKTAHKRIDNCELGIREATQNLNATLMKIERGME